MREIKFRAKGQTDDRWYYGYVRVLNDDVCHITESELRTYICKTKTLGQNTGLKDKNGVEIYEGDIIRCIDLDGEIKYCEEDGMFILEAENVQYNFCNENSKDYEVVGNIHEVEQ